VFPVFRLTEPVIDSWLGLNSGGYVTVLDEREREGSDGKRYNSYLKNE